MTKLQIPAGFLLPMPLTMKSQEASIYVKKAAFELSEIHCWIRFSLEPQIQIRMFFSTRKSHIKEPSSSSARTPESPNLGTSCARPMDMPQSRSRCTRKTRPTPNENGRKCGRISFWARSQICHNPVLVMEVGFQVLALWPSSSWRTYTR